MQKKNQQQASSMELPSKRSSSSRHRKASKTAPLVTSRDETQGEVSHHSSDGTHTKKSGAKRRHRKRPPTAPSQVAPEVSGFNEVTSSLSPVPLASSSHSGNEVAGRKLPPSDQDAGSTPLFSAPTTATCQRDRNLLSSGASPSDGTQAPNCMSVQDIGNDMYPGRGGCFSAQQDTPEPLLKSRAWLIPGSYYGPTGSSSPMSAVSHDASVPTELPFGNAPPLTSSEKSGQIECLPSPQDAAPLLGTSMQPQPDIASFGILEAGTQEPSSFAPPNSGAPVDIPPATMPSAPAINTQPPKNVGCSYQPVLWTLQSMSLGETPSPQTAWLSSLKMPTMVKASGPIPSEEETLDEEEWKVFCALVLCIAAVLAFTAVGVLMMRPRINTEPQLCTSEDCLAHGSWLTGRLNNSVDPCEDFSAFTCASFKPSSGAYSGTSEYDLLAAWFGQVAPLLEDGAGRVLAAAKARAAFRTCMQQEPKDAARSLSLLHDFMRERHIPWPEMAETHVSPLSVLLDLAFNWQLPLWMTVRVQRRGLGDRAAIMLSRGKYVPFWANQHLALISMDAYERHWFKYLTVLGRDDTRSPRVDEALRMAAMMTDVLKRLLAVEKRATPTPAHFPLRNIAKFTGNISIMTWMAALNENVKIEPKFTGTDAIFVSDAALLQAVDALFGSYSRTELLQHIRWFFVVTHLPLGSISMLENGLTPTARPVFCASGVEASYGVLLASLYVSARFPEKVRSDITFALGNITKAALDKMGSIHWNKVVPTKAALKKLEQVKILLWPPERLLTRSGLDEMYAAFLSHADTFIAFWLDGHRHLRELSADNRFSMALAYPRNSQPPLLDYDRLLDTVSFSVAALAPPVYYGRSTPAMLYSGLGFAFAQQLAKAFDSLELVIGPEGEMVPTSESAAWADAVTERRECMTRADFTATGVEDIFPEVPALELAHTAFLSALSHDQSFKTTLNFTEEQTFLIAICRGMCAHRDGRVAVLYGNDCNKAMRNFAPFASAFGCRKGSRMNPTHKCSFFQ